VKISLLCATLGKRQTEFAKLIQSLNLQTNQDFELIVVSQGGHNWVKHSLLSATFSHVHLESTSKGISAARNEGLPFLTGDILMLADDDCWYDACALSTVSECFKTTTAAVLCFKHIDPVTQTTYKRYSNSPLKNLGYISLLSLASIDICIDLRQCRSLVRFDERFGVGTANAVGEECILLTELKKAGYCIGYIPVTLAYHPTKQQQKSVTSKDRKTKAAIFIRLYGRALGTMLFLLYLVKNIRYLCTSHSMGNEKKAVDT